MSGTVLKVENLSKRYRLGVIGATTLRDDLARKWASLRNRQDPTHKIGLEKFYNSDATEFWALKGVNFEVNQGDTVGIIGKNGAGKSTLLKILSKITAPTEGHIKVKGKIASLLEVGTGFHPELTGRENIYMNGAILGMSKREIKSKLDEIIDFSGIDQHIDTPVKRYSSGMYVRLAFSVAAHLESDILIVDEVLAVGDADFQKKCLGKMKDVSSQQGKTVLFVSHNIAQVQNLCNRSILLEKGKVVCDDTTKIVLDRYLGFSDENLQNEFILKDKSYHPNTDIAFRTNLVRIENDVLNIRENDYLYVTIKFEADKAINDVVYDIVISNSGNSNLILVRSQLGDLHIQAGKEYTIRGKVKLNLTQGLYNLSIGAHGGVGPLDWHENLTSLVINPEDVMIDMQKKENMGIVITQSQWELL